MLPEWWLAMKLFINRFLTKSAKRQSNTSGVTGDNHDFFWQLGYKTVKDLETEEGILASGKNEIYGAIFGRDSLITSLKLLTVYRQTKTSDFLIIVRKVLQTLASLQGKEVNLESGEEPGKSIHEFRPDGHEHLTGRENKPWFVYSDGVMRNYDTVDATPLFLIAVYRYYQASQDKDFLNQVLPKVISALDWLKNFADKNEDGLVDFQLDPLRSSGGLLNQNWMDSTESTFHETGEEVVYPLAPVEAQAYTYLAYRLWSRFFYTTDKILAHDLEERADSLKRIFNSKFVLNESGKTYLASAIDGSGLPLASARSNMGHTLWASLNKEMDGVTDSILETRYTQPVVERLLQSDLFEPEAGIRTLSNLSVAFNPHSYHNGSIWPHDNSMIAEGFENFGFLDEAELVREALLKAVFHFKTPVELFVYDQTYIDYLSETGQSSCKTQAWSAAAILTSISATKSETNSSAILVSWRPKQLTNFLSHSLVRLPLTPWVGNSLRLVDPRPRIGKINQKFTNLFPKKR
jgi:glycogen debranching enzyme